jgi:ubiquinone/menaquinone biosynthesis C-methylase UbiE
MTHTLSPHFGREATATTYRDIHLPRVFAPWARILVEIVPARAGEAVLDVATGPGTVAREAAAQVGPNGQVVGVDISGAMLAIARSFPRQPAAADIQYLESSATAIPLQDARFDVAYCQHGLQHMTEPMRALAELKRLLKPGGRLGVAIWNQSPFGPFREAVASVNVSDGGPQPSTLGREPDDLERVLREAGFDEVRVQQRELVAVLEGGVPQALEMALATSAGAGVSNLSAAQQEAVRAALLRAVTPLAQPDGVHLKSVSNIASAVKR